ncbi:MAG: glycosyltransferase [Bacteroidaceae bacterium]|nr:glycosyltransferase [Bacteroidaceae bacterium]
MPAPVALFVYNRADNMLQTLECLVRNTLAPKTDLYVFSDGGKDPKSWSQVNAVRAQLHQFKTQVDHEGALHSMTIIERPENYYLERNITEGIAQVFQDHDRIIVLEDDILTSPYYLQYMNQAFDLYADIPRVMHVAGFTNLAIGASPSDTPLPISHTSHHPSPLLLHPPHVRMGLGHLARPLAAALCPLQDPRGSPAGTHSRRPRRHPVRRCIPLSQEPRQATHPMGHLLGNRHL